MLNRRPRVVTFARALVAMAVLSLALPHSASAQTAPPPRQEGTAELAFVGTSGNSSTSTFSAGALHIARPNGWTVRNRLLFVRGTSDGSITAESLLYAFRVERRLNARTSAFGDYGYFRDEPAGVSHRNNLAAGLAFKVVDSGRQTLNTDAGFGYLNEQRLTGNDVSSATYNLGAAYKFKLSETSDLTDDLRLLGTFSQADDWRLTHTMALTARLTTLFSLKVSNVVRYANSPPLGFKKTDTTTSVALVASFKRP